MRPNLNRIHEFKLQFKDKMPIITLVGVLIPRAGPHNGFNTLHLFNSKTVKFSINKKLKTNNFS